MKSSASHPEGVKEEQRMSFITRILGVLTLLYTPTPTLAQACGTFAEAADHLLMHREVFEGAEWADTRAALGIEPISPTDSVRLVTDTATCTSLISKEVTRLGLPGNPNTETYTVYRYGAYYAIEYRPPPRRPGDPIFYHGWARLRVYTVGQGQMLKGTIRVNS